MAGKAGPYVNNDGLVFHYDTGNTVRSFKGEPTVNVLNNNILGQGSGAFLSSDSIGTYIQLADLTTGYSRFQLPSIPVSSNDTYTWSFELMSPETITTNFYFDTNEYSDQFPASNDLSRASATARVPSTMPAGVWQQFSLTVTMKPDLTGAYTYDFFNMLYPTFQNRKVYYRNMQFEFKNHPTQYAGQGVTRSATQGLLDLTGNSTIDLTNVSFDSNAQMTFDGTDDWINVGQVNSLLGQTAVSVEFIVDMATALDSNDRKVFHYSKAGTTNGVFQVRKGSDNSQLMYQYNSAGTWYTLILPNAITSPDTFNHFIFTHSGTEVRAYKNGEFVTNGIFAAGLDWADADALYIGYRVNAEYWKGDIPMMKIYNRALTASEVERNFNAVRTRFGI